MSELTHLDEHGAARMVDVSEKAQTRREASAEALIVLSEAAYAAVTQGSAPKGDVLAAARIAGIMAAKKTSELIPLCHAIALSKVEVRFEPDAERHAFRIIAEARTVGQTGVEMEALTAASIAALTIYDMVKAIDRGAQIEAIRLLAKSGGKSGAYSATHRAIAGRPVQPRLGTKPATLAHETAAAVPQADANAQREAFRAFMVSRQLRATEWAKQAGVPASQIYSYLTGRSRGLAPEIAERLARAAQARVEDLFRR